MRSETTHKSHAQIGYSFTRPLPSLPHNMSLGIGTSAVVATTEEYNPLRREALKITTQTPPAGLAPPRGGNYNNSKSRYLDRDEHTKNLGRTKAKIRVCDMIIPCKAFN